MIAAIACFIARQKLARFLLGLASEVFFTLGFFIFSRVLFQLMKIQSGRGKELFLGI